MSIFNDDDAVCIERRSLHVVGEDHAKFEPQPEFDDQGHDRFFLDRIQSSAPAPVFAFDPNSRTKAVLERVARSDVQFEAGAQELASSFSELHVESAVPGAFFVFQLGVGSPSTLVFALMKYDYRQALELLDLKGPQKLRSIVHAFVTEPRAIQKACLVRVVDGVAAEAVSATDRMRQGADIGDYFRRFLGVSRTQTDQELSVKLLDVLRATLSSVRDVLPGRDIPAALEVAKNAIRSRGYVTEDAIREAVFVAGGRPDDETTQVRFERETTKQLRQKGLSGVEFAPIQSVLAQKARRRLLTAEGVTVQYPGEEEGRSVIRVPDDGGFVITIRTKEELVKDDVLAIETR